MTEYSTAGLMEAALVDFAASFSLESAGGRAIDAAKARLLDSIGVAMAAYLAPPARIARRMAQPTAGSLQSRVWGSGIMTTPDAAAFANGVMVRYLDLNDAYRTLDAHHPSDYIPGILAVAEATGASGRDFLAAVIVAYEIMCRFTDRVPFNDRGWDQPVSGALATSIACGRLLGLTREAFRDAIALALVPNLCTYQTRAGELSMWKGCAGPNGARNGVFAALLAAEGMSGPYQAFDGVFGVWKQTTDGDVFKIDLPQRGHMGSWGIYQSNIKSFPVRDSCQLPIMTALQLREKLAARTIDRLVIDTYKSAYAGAVKDPELWAPKTRETADHSMLFSAACALIDGKVTPDSFEAGRFLDKDVLELIAKTTVNILDEFTEQAPAIRNCRITAISGQDEIAAHKVVTLAEIEAGMPDEQIERKFRECSSRVFDEARQDAVIAAVAGLDRVGNISDFSTILTL